MARITATPRARMAYLRQTGLRPQDAAGLRRIYHGYGVRLSRYLTGLYDGTEAGMDVEGGRWQTVCERHHHVISHRTRELAESHLCYPETWCETCMHVATRDHIKE